MVASKWVACVLVFSWSALTVPAKTQVLPPQLRMLLRESRPDSNRVKLLLELGAHYLYKPQELKADLDSALHFTREAAILSETIRDEKWRLESLRLLSCCYFERKEVRKGREAFMQVLADCRKTGDPAREAAAWLDMAGRMHRNDSTHEEVIHYFQKAITLHDRPDQEVIRIAALKEIADVHLNQGKLEESEKGLLEVIDRYQAVGYRNLHYTYDLLAAVSTLRGNLNKALLYGQEMLKSMEATGDSVAAGTFYYRMARISGDLGRTAEGVAWFKKAYAKSTDANYGLCLSVVRGLVQLGKVTEALAFVQEVTRKSAPVTILEKAYHAHASGLCYNALHEYELAEKYYREMIRYEALLQMQNSYTSRANLDIGSFFVHRRRYPEAEPYLRKVLGIPAGIVTAQNLQETHFLLFKVDSAAGRYLEAIRHFQQGKLLNDSIFSEAKSHQIEELQVRYETEKKEQDIRLLQQESQLHQSRLLQLTTTQNLTFGGIALLLIGMGLVYGRFRTKLRVTRQLEIQQIEINQTNRSLQNLLEEKEWLLREIHHRVKNNLQIVMSLLNTQSAYLENADALTAIRHSQHRIHSIALIHQKLYQSKNVTLIGMSLYIRELVDYLRDSFDPADRIQFDLQVDNSVKLDVTQAVPVGLILNEAISNTLKYAFPNDRAGNITISMQLSAEDRYLLTIADNGIGLPADFDLHQSNSLGISLMKGLSKQLGGNLELTNHAGLTIGIEFRYERIAQPAATPAAMAFSV